MGLPDDARERQAAAKEQGRAKKAAGRHAQAEARLPHPDGRRRRGRDAFDHIGEVHSLIISRGIFSARGA